MCETPLLFIVKSDGYHSSGHLERFSSISDCAGVVKFIADKPPGLYVVLGEGMLIMPEIVGFLNIPMLATTVDV